MTLRPARASDAAAIAAIHVETWRATYPGLVPDAYLVGLCPRIYTERWRRSLSAGQSETVLVIEGQDGGLQAFGSAGRARQRGAPASGEIFTLYVHPDHQGQGLGARLLRALLDILRNEGHTAAFLWVLSGNPARFFYQAQGGALAGQQQERFAGALLDEEAYTWRTTEDTKRSKKP
ncbi:MAG: GNAT family N-acetyltransferase [Pseudomonadota bacterium]